MKIQITVTDDLGRTYTGQAELVAAVAGTRKQTPGPKRAESTSRRPQKGVDFALGIRAFIKRHVTNKTSGPSKFVILLAWVAKGSTSEHIEVDKLEKQWAKVKGPMGGVYQRVYATRAKDNGWVDSPKNGVFHLQAGWKDAFME